MIKKWNAWKQNTEEKALKKSLKCPEMKQDVLEKLFLVDKGKSFL